MNSSQCQKGASTRKSSPIYRYGLGRSQLFKIRAEASPAWKHQPLDVKSVTLKAGNKEIKLETGEIGRQANGSIMATCGETMVYVTACCSDFPTGDGQFVPLTVNYAERFSAAGKTSGGYIKRDGRPRDADTLMSRLVDRPLRPMFTNGWANETQVLEWVVSYDGVNAPEPIAITAAAAALLISDIPFEKAVAGVRVGYIPGEDRFVVNPSIQDQERSVLDLMLAGTKDAILMIEGFCDFLTEDQMLKAVSLGHEAVAAMCHQLEAWAAVVGKPKRKSGLVLLPEGLEEKIKKLVGPDLVKAYTTSSTKLERSVAEGTAESVVQRSLGPSSEGGTSPAPTPLQLNVALKSVKSWAMRTAVLDTGRRMDGRSLTDVRPITSRAGPLLRTHGSVLFTRGETQALCVTTLGSKLDAQKAETIRGDGDEPGDRFYLQYHFPPSSVGEVGRVGGPGRRELGHGELAQRALAPTLPPESQFPYVVRVESTITESNGSSSMASVCGGCLAMMDAGVPIARPIAGIAMGLILEPDGRFSVLSDILGSEDALGDMDFKVAGDKDTITAFQMDIKVEGITLDIMRKAIAQAGDGRRHILGEMAKCNPAPRGNLSAYAPKVVRFKVDPSKKGQVIGPGGRIIKQIKDATKATIDLDEEGNVEVTAATVEAAQQAADYISLIVEDPPAGKVFRARRVTSVQMFGAFVELGPGREGLVHISQIDIVPVNEVASVISPGDFMDVMVLESGNGKISLSRKAVMMQDGGQAVDKLISSSSGVTEGGAGGGRGRGRGMMGGPLAGGRGGGGMRRP